jgi:pimeloyl-ACP methyl ester carboxylesterase
MAASGGHVFISYHRDDRELAERIRAGLVAQRVRTWMDLYDVRPGAYWPDEVDRGLGEASLVLGILSPDAVASRNVKNEWDWALQNDKRLILVMARPCVIPHRYVSINFIDAVDGDVERCLETLLRDPDVRPAPSTLAVPRTHYARAGDVNVAYQVFGEGAVDLVYVPGYISHVEHVWRLPGNAAFLAGLASFARVMMFDKRGTGMSDRTGRISTMEERMADIEAVMDACESRRAVIMGISEGVGLSILFGAAHPERTRALVLYGGRASYTQQPDYPWQRPYAEQLAEIEAAGETLFATWGSEQSAAEAVAIRAPSAKDDQALIAWWAEFQRLGASPGAEIARQRMNLGIDVRGVLPLVRVPALVIGRVGDRSVRIEEMRYVAERIPGATMVELAGDDHVLSSGDQEALVTAIARFVKDVAENDAPTPESALATAVVFGFAGNGAEALAQAVSHEVGRFHGVDIATGEPGPGAVFDGPIRAIRFAEAVMRRLEGHGTPVGCGVQAGEIAAADAKPSGPAIEAAARLAEVARPGQIVTTGMVRSLVSGSELRFEPAGEGATPGFDGIDQVLLLDRSSLG